MRVLILVTLITLTTNMANAFSFTPKKAGADAEGNCLPEVLTENARLYSEIEELDKIATRCEAQLKSPLKDSQKLGFDGLKELGTKAKASRKAIAHFGETYKDIGCKAQMPKAGTKTMEVIMLNIPERVTTLDKLATTYEQIADNFLKSHVAKK